MEAINAGFIKRHWKPIALVGVGAFAFYYAGGFGALFGTSGGSTATASGVDPNAAALQAATMQGQLQLATAAQAANAQETVAQIAADTQTQLAAIAAGAQVQNTSLLTGAAAYEATVGAQRDVAQYTLAVEGMQNQQATQALEQGFTNYIVASAQRDSQVASAAAGVAKANDAEVTASISAALGGIASIAGAFTGNGPLNMFSSQFAKSYSSIIPTSLPFFNAGNQNYVDSGTFDVQPATA